MARSAQLDRLSRKLTAIPKAVEQSVRQSMEKSANEIVALAKSLCPVDRGDLRDSISWTWGDAPEGSIVLASTSGAAMRITIYAGSDEAFYAKWVEFGTKKMEAHPYFFPAYRTLRKRVKSRTKRDINKAFKQHWGK